jgi:hypothetical protein
MRERTVSSRGFVVYSMQVWVTLVASAATISFHRDDLVVVLRARRPSRQLVQRICVGDHRRFIDEHNLDATVCV